MDLQKILTNHKLWVESYCTNGVRAYLSGADLRDADLRGADLRGADLSGADLRDAYLSRADLRGADLRDAYLSRADLRDADLSGAYLRGAKGMLYQPCGKYVIIYNGKSIGLGCMWHTLEEWLSLCIEEIRKQDSSIDSDWFDELKTVLPAVVKLYDLWQKLI